MTVLEAIQLTVDLPVFSVKTRSLRRRVMNVSTGGRIMRDSAERIYVRALHEVSFKLQEGERLGLVGHNGAGKSTLLRTLAGIYKPSQGQVIVNGTSSAALDVWMGLDGEASGEENVVSLARYRGQSRKAALEILPEVIEFSELGGFLDMPVKTYSAGMVARLTFAVATSFPSDVLFMDEWIGAVDHSFLGKAQDRLENYFSKARAVVIATHDHDILRRFCTKVLVLEGGRLKAIGSPHDIIPT